MPKPIEGGHARAQVGLLEPRNPARFPWAVQLSGLCPELQLANNLNSSKAEGPVLPDGIGGKKLRLGLQGQRGDVLGIVFQESTS